MASLAQRQALRLRVFVRRTRLDEELAEGIDPRSRPALALRAAQLVRSRYRRREAAALQRLVADFDAHRGRWLSAAIPFLRDQVGEARGTLLLLAYALRTAERVQPRGVAIVSRLLRDPASSPLYVGSARGALQLKAQTALDCLLGERQTDANARSGTWSSEGGSGGDR